MQDGYACPTCDSVLSTSRGIEVGNVFKLDTRYSEAFGCTYPGQDDVQRPVVMGCYGIGVGRLLAATVEQNTRPGRHGTPGGRRAVRGQARRPQRRARGRRRGSDALYNNLTEAGVEVLYDDRQESVGVKFNDAELLGLPILLVVSPRNITKDVVEVRRRAGGESTLVPRGVVSEYVQSLLTRPLAPRSPRPLRPTSRTAQSSSLTATGQERGPLSPTASGLSGIKLLFGID